MVNESAVQSASTDLPVDLTGDAYCTFTAPFYAEGDPLEPSEECTIPPGGDLDGTGTLLEKPISWELLLQGTLTYQWPTMDLLTTFVGSDEWQHTIHEELSAFIGQNILEKIEIFGALYPDGYGSIAVTLHLRAGWDAQHRPTLLTALGLEGREALAACLRDMLLPPVNRLLRRCTPGEAAVIPYFNLTYAGGTDHPAPGRALLSDHLRTLLYPDSPMPLSSHSPLAEEFLYAGYAYNLLAMREPRRSAEKFTLLLLVLDVAYIRLARTAAAADGALHTRGHEANTQWLAQLGDRLRSEYQSLVTPTFSFDHHALRMRDAVLRSWEAGNLQSRTEDLLKTVRQTVDLELAEEQAGRIRMVKGLVTALTVLSTIATVEAAVSLIDRFFG